MADSLSAPVLEATLARLRGRERRRGRDASIRRTLVAVSLAVLLVCTARVTDLVMGRPPLPVPLALATVAFVAAVGAGFVLRGVVGRSEAEISRDMDRRLGLDDRASAALCVLRGGASTRLGPYVIADAEAAIRGVAARVDAEFPEKPERRVTWLVRWLARAAAAAIVLTIIAQLLTFDGPIRILPGISIGGGEPQALVPATKDSPHRDGAKPRPEPPQPAEPREPDATKPSPAEPAGAPR